MLRSIVLATAIFLAPGIASAQSLEGVWSLVEAETTSGPDAGMVSRQPGLLIFTGRHYSHAYVNSAEARPRLSDSPTDAERGRVFTPYTSNTGTYERDGSTVNIRVLVAKSPGRMEPGGPGNVVSREITELTTTTLVMTSSTPSGNVTYRYTRVE